MKLTVGRCHAVTVTVYNVCVGYRQAVNTLSVRAGSLGPAGAWLQRACAAYCFITVPSLHCALTKLQLYLLSGQVALLNKCIGQGQCESLIWLEGNFQLIDTWFVALMLEPEPKMDLLRTS